jgi:6-phosphogluconolactonase
VHEVDRSNVGGEISAFSFDKKKGTLTLINKQPSRGDHPCYVDIDKTGKYVFTGNYSSGSLSVLPVTKDGGVGEAFLIQHTGAGPDPQRQNKPHVHCTIISPDNKYLFVPDLGIDKMMIYAFDEKTGSLIPAKKQNFAASAPGDGPRHFTFHPNGKYGYLITELTGNVIAYGYKDGELTELQRISTKPADKEGFAGSADIHVSPDGKFLYASNRGDFNSIASYKIDQATGKLTAIENISTLGKAPRNFSLDPTGDFVLVANQQSDEIVVFKKDQQTGVLTDSNKRVKVFSPVCIKWMKM